MKTTTVPTTETPPTRTVDSLSAREREVFNLVLQSKKNIEIADALGISPKTVETHRSHINKKLNAHSTADLIRIAAAHGLLGGVEPVGVAVEAIEITTDNDKNELVVAVRSNGVVAVVWRERILALNDTIVSEFVEVEGLRNAIAKAVTRSLPRAA
jgi:DNA-binding CsgD family transcriptional regulator